MVDIWARLRSQEAFLDQDQKQALRPTHASLITGNALLRRSVEFPDELIALNLLSEAAWFCYLYKEVMVSLYISK